MFNLADTFEISLLMFFVYLVAGAVKGIIGIGLPSTGMTLLTTTVSPIEALGLNLLPMFTTNIFQFYLAKNKKSLIITYWKYAFIMCLLFFYFSFQVVNYSNNFLSLIISISIILFSLTNIIFKNISINPKRENFWQILFGIFSGILGGLTSMWGVPLTAYLIMKNLKARQFIDISGFLIFVGCIPLSIGYVKTNVFSEVMIFPGTVGVLAALIGFKIGEITRKYISQNFFRKLVLTFFLIMGIRMAIESIIKFI